MEPKFELSSINEEIFDKLSKLKNGSASINDDVLNKSKKYIEMAGSCYKYAKLCQKVSIDVDDQKDFYAMASNTNSSIEQVEGNFSAFLFAFSTELLLKTIYVLTAYDGTKTVDQYFEDARRSVNGTTSVQNVYDPNINPQLSQQLQSIGENLPRRGNGHYLKYLLENITNNYTIDLIKYETIISHAKVEYYDGIFPKPEDFIKAPELVSIMREFKDDEYIKTNNTQSIKNSEAFQKNRYIENNLQRDELLYLESFALASYIALVDVIYSKLFNINELNNIIIKENLTTINDQLINDPSFQNRFKDFKDAFPYDFYILITKFKKEEIECIVNNYNNNPMTSFEDYLKYYIFFKKYITSDIFKYDEQSIPNVSKFFEKIRNTNDLSLLGAQFIEWFNSIDIKDLTEEEFEILEVFDPKYIYNSLNYKDKIIYEKCKKYNIKFDFSYYFNYKNFEYICKNYNELFFNKKISLDILMNVDRFKGLELDLVKKIINEFILADCLSMYDILDICGGDVEKIKEKEERLKAIATLIKDTDLSFIKSLCVSDAVTIIENEERLRTIATLIKDTGLSYGNILSMYGHDIDTIIENEEKIKTIAPIIKEIGLSFYDIKLLCGNDIEKIKENEEKIKTIAPIIKEIGLSIYDITSLCGNDVEKIKENEERLRTIATLIKDTGLSIYDIESLCGNDVEKIKENEEKIKTIAPIIKEIGLSIYDIGLFCGRDVNKIIENEERLRTIATLIKDTGLSIYDIKSLCGNDVEKIIENKEKIKTIATLSKDTGLSIFDIKLLCGNDVEKIIENEEKIKTIATLSKDTSLSIYDITSFCDNNVEKLKEISTIIKNAKFTPDMKVLSLPDLVKNCELIGYENISDCIFYKTPQETQYIIDLCKNSKIDFRKEFLYANMETFNYLNVFADIFNAQANKITTLKEVRRIEDFVKTKIEKEKPKKSRISKFRFFRHPNEVIDTSEEKKKK